MNKESSPRKIGVIADTHNRWMPRVAEIFRDVSEIWHLGDVCDEAILDELRLINPKLTVVLGNNDFRLAYPLEIRLHRAHERFYLTHIPPHTTPENTDWVLHGHTHVPRNELIHGVRFFNPGSAGLANKGAPLSVGILVQEKDGPFRAEVIRL